MKALKELFDSPIEFSEFFEDSDFIYSLFKIKDKEYIVAFYDGGISKFKYAQDMFNVNFNNSKVTHPFAFAFGLLNKDSTNPLMDIISGRIRDTTTNTGDVFLVFSTVGHIVIKFLKKYKPDAIYYAPKEENRYKIYKALTVRLKTFFDNYIVWENNNFYIVYKSELKENFNVTLKVI